MIYPHMQMWADLHVWELVCEFVGTSQRWGPCSWVDTWARWHGHSSHAGDPVVRCNTAPARPRWRTSRLRTGRSSRLSSGSWYGSPHHSACVGKKENRVGIQSLMFAIMHVNRGELTPKKNSALFSYYSLYHLHPTDIYTLNTHTATYTYVLTLYAHTNKIKTIHTLSPTLTHIALIHIHNQNVLLIKAICSHFKIEHRICRCLLFSIIFIH